MSDKKSAPWPARSSEVQVNGQELRTKHNRVAPPVPPPPAQSSKYTNIPEELRQRSQWVSCAEDKKPRNPRTGALADVNVPGTWGTFEEACGNGMKHIGFVFTPGDPYCGIDIDDKAEKPATEAELANHKVILEHFASYTEQSIGDRWTDSQGRERGGYHVLIRGQVDQGRDHGHVGVYSHSRFFTFTGKVVRNAPIVDYQSLLDQLVAGMHASGGDVSDLVEAEPEHTDVEIDRRIRNAANGSKYAELYAGRWQQFKEYPTQSEADFALLGFLCFHSVSNEQCRRMFKESGLFRKKATRAYMDRSLAKLRAEQDTCQVRTDAAKWFAPAVANTQGQSGDDAGDDDLPPIRGPEVTPAMYYGLVGKVMLAASKGTEVHPAAAGLSFITMSSAALGRDKFFQIGDEQHHARINAMHVGPSSRAGKGMATALTKRIRKEVDRLRDPVADGQYACGNYHSGGLSSGEGLIYEIRDASEPNSEGKIIDPGVPDKRLYVFESEIANVLRQGKRDGNTLSVTIRDAFDGSDLAPATKNNRIRATEPHICIYGGITPFELRESLDQNNLTNGFANRFLFCAGERMGIVPFPPPTPDDVVTELAQGLLAAIRLAKSAGPVIETEGAKALYDKFYRDNRRGRGRSERLRGLLQRHPPYAWRLSLLFALLDCKNEIDDCHMGAAIAWLDYCKDSTIAIFSTARDEARVGEANELGDKIIGLLEKAPNRTMDRESLRVLLVKPKAKELDPALQHLIDGLMIKEIVTPQRGKPRRDYQLIGVAPPAPVNAKGAP